MISHDQQTIVSRLRAAGCVFAEEEAAILIESAGSDETLAGMIERRIAGVPLEHVVGWVSFCGLRIQVDPGVFVPRQRSELLVRQAVRVTQERAATADAPLTIVDLACGCGALGLAAATLLPEPGSRVFAVDVEEAAVACARRNLEPVAGQAFLGDLYAALPTQLRGRVDLIVANVPYVPTTEVALMPREARAHEPLIALDGGGDGLDVLRRVVASAGTWLTPGGHVVLETSQAQALAALLAMTAAGLTPSSAYDDDLYATAVIGRRSL